MLGDKADRSDGSVRLAFVLYYDDVEVVNALGAFTGVHKLGLFYWSVVNLHQSERMALHNIHLATVALESDISYYGIAQIVSGVIGEPDTGSSIGASLRLLDHGYPVNLNSCGTPVSHMIRGWLVLVAADYPAAGLLSGSMMGASARKFCRECNIDTGATGYKKSNSFVDPKHPSRFALRSPATYAASKQRCGCDLKKMAADGWTSWEHAFVRIPLFDLTCGIPYDLMHCEFEGVVKSELAAFIFYAVRVLGCFTLDQLNTALDSHPFPPGERPPYFTEGIKQGRGKKKEKLAAPTRKSPKSKVTAAPASPSLLDEESDEYESDEEAGTITSKLRPKKGCHLHMTAGHTVTFAMHSAAIFRALGVPENDPAFQCWLTHLDYLHILMHSILLPLKRCSKWTTLSKSTMTSCSRLRYMTEYGSPRTTLQSITHLISLTLDHHVIIGACALKH